MCAWNMPSTVSVLMDIFHHKTRPLTGRDYLTVPNYWKTDGMSRKKPCQGTRLNFLNISQIDF